MRLTKTSLLLLSAALSAGILIAQEARQTRNTQTKIDDNTLKNAARSGEEWVTYGRDYAETHFSPLNQIDATNVKRVGLAWAWETESPAGARIESTPLMSNGVLYATLGWNVMVAVDARTGKQKWRWDPEIPRKHISEICCGPVNRGVALYKGKVYAGLLDGRLVALDQETGKVLWSVKTTTNDDTVLTAAVRVVKGKVIVGTSGAEQAVRGYFSAYDAETGKMAWRFYTVPGDPSKPFEQPELAMAAKTWTGEWWKMGGGGTVWDAMAYDPDADLLYIGTGNGGPWDRNLRSPGGGDNLFLASVLAVKPETGKLVWYFQETPGDDWDYTSTQPIVLADLNVGGRQRKVLMHAPKNGFFYVLDRISGEFISGGQYARRVTWATGLDKNGHPIEAKGARYGVNPVLIAPGNGGAHNWEAMAFSPLAGLVYIPGTEGGAHYARDPKFVYTPGTQNAGMSTMQRPRDQEGKVIPPDPPDVPVVEPEGAENQSKNVGGGFLVAWDPVTQKERWRVPSVGGYLRGGATLATAGNLLFHDSKAYNAQTGEMLWQAELNGESVAPVTYMLDGKQYVTYFARSYPNSRLFSFVLDGKEAIPPTPAAPKP